MMQSKEKITRANAMNIIRRFAKEYSKTLGKAPAEIIIVGGLPKTVSWGSGSKNPGAVPRTICKKRRRVKGPV